MRLYSITDAAEILHVSRPTVWRMVADGRLPVIRLGKKTVRVSSEVLDSICTNGVAALSEAC